MTDTSIALFYELLAPLAEALLDRLRSSGYRIIYPPVVKSEVRSKHREALQGPCTLQGLRLQDRQGSPGVRGGSLILTLMARHGPKVRTTAETPLGVQDRPALLLPQPGWSTLHSKLMFTGKIR